MTYDSWKATDPRDAQPQGRLACGCWDGCDGTCALAEQDLSELVWRYYSLLVWGRTSEGKIKWILGYIGAL